MGVVKKHQPVVRSSESMLEIAIPGAVGVSKTVKQQSSWFLEMRLDILSAWPAFKTQTEDVWI